MRNVNLIYNQRCGYIVLPGDMGSLYCQLPALYVDMLPDFDHSWSVDVVDDSGSFNAFESNSLFDHNKTKPIIEKEKRLAKKPRSLSLQKNEHITKINIQDKVYMPINFLLYDFSTINRSSCSNIILNLHSSLEYLIKEITAIVINETNMAINAAKNRSCNIKLIIMNIAYKIVSVIIVTIFLVDLMPNFSSSITIVNNPHKEIT